jgi:hypothetical protein
LIGVVWQRLDVPGLEYATIALDPLRIEGELVVVEEGVPCAVSYAVEPGRVFVVLKRECKRVERTIDVPGDIDLSVTPSTNTLPLRRLNLQPGQSAEVTASWVRFPSLDVEPLRQVYRCIDATTFAYEAPDLGFEAEIVCDESKIVRRYGDLWAAIRISSASV